MKPRAVGYSYIAVMVIMLVVIALTLPMKYSQSKQLPLVFSSLVFVLAAVGLWRDFSIKKTRGTTTSEDKAKEKKSSANLGGYLAIWVWIVGFFLAVYLLGFVIAIAAFVLAYTKSHGVKWWLALIYSVLATVFVYAIFERLLDVVLYRGLLLTQLG
ncbi:MAG: tripartite tricarboxylate transporter TctB family protein [Chloroflexi bacterium]|nr:tripartite tricarboxylate transporter TctB family protein [Chloroflexota bacterium]